MIAVRVATNYHPARMWAHGFPINEQSFPPTFRSIRRRHTILTGTIPVRPLDRPYSLFLHFLATMTWYWRRLYQWPPTPLVFHWAVIPNSWPTDTGPLRAHMFPWPLPMAETCIVGRSYPWPGPCPIHTV